MPQWKSLVAAAAVASLLGGCTFLEKAPPPDKPQVAVKDGKIAVAPEPLDFRDKPGEVTISWSLPADSPYTFDRSGIVIEDSKQPPVRAADEFVKCAPSENGKSFSCLNLHKGKGYHKYTINVREGDRKLPPFDPHIAN